MILSLVESVSDVKLAQRTFVWTIIICSSSYAVLSCQVLLQGYFLQFYRFPHPLNEPPRGRALTTIKLMMTKTFIINFIVVTFQPKKQAEKRGIKVCLSLSLHIIGKAILPFHLFSLIYFVILIPLIFNVISDHIFVSMITDCSNIVATRPKISTP